VIFLYVKLLNYIKRRVSFYVTNQCVSINVFSVGSSCPDHSAVAY